MIPPENPVESWPLEGVQAALERGSLKHWRRLAAAIQAQPWGPVARAVEEVLTYSRPYGVAEAMERVIAQARRDGEMAERAAVSAEVQRLVEKSGLSRQEFASRIGTSASRLSTYATGKVVPSATLLVRMQQVAQSCNGLAVSSDSKASGFLSLLGAWKDQIEITDDFDDLPDDLAEALGMKS